MEAVADVVPVGGEGERPETEVQWPADFALAE